MYGTYELSDYDINGNYDIWKAMDNRDVEAEYDHMNNNVIGSIESFLITLFNFIMIMTFACFVFHTIVFHVVPFVIVGVTKGINVLVGMLIHWLYKVLWINGGGL